MDAHTENVVATDVAIELLADGGLVSRHAW